MKVVKNMEENKFVQTDEEVAIHYLRTFSDTAREPFLILDPDLKVVGANESFYKNFQVTKKDTEGQMIYELGNGQWNIPELRKLLEDILPQKKVFNDYEVSHDFPTIGLKIMLLNARKLDDTHQILLAIEDITARKAIEIKLASYTKELEKTVGEKTTELTARIDELEKINKLMIGRELKMAELKDEITELKKQKDA